MPRATDMSIPLRALSRDIEIVNEWEKALTGRETSSTSRIGKGEEGGLHHELGHDDITSGPQGLLNPYLAHALLHGDEHDVGYPEAAYNQGKCSDDPSGLGDTGEDSVRRNVISLSEKSSRSEGERP